MILYFFQFIFGVQCALVELERCFMDGTNNAKFVDACGWYARRRDMSSNPITQSQSVAGNQYFGLSLVYQDDGLTRVIENIPAHSMLKIEGKFAVYGQQTIFMRRLQIRLDNKFIMSYTFHQQVSTSPLNPFLYEFSVYASHSYQTAILQFTNDFAVQYGILTMGIREMIISYLPCPIGCDICFMKDKQSLCKLWILQHSTFQKTPLFSNDGWSVSGKMNYFKCQGTNFGIFDNSVFLNRTILLEPHYEIRITFLLTQIDFDQYQIVPFTLELDFNQIYGYHFLVQDNQPDICEDTALDRDVVERFDVRAQHQKRFATFSFYQPKTGIITNVAFTLRNFQIFIKKCYTEVGFNCDECTGAAKENCIQSAKVYNFQNVLQLNTVNNGWQVILPESFTPKICNGLYMLQLDATVAKDYYIQKIIPLIRDHQKLKIQFDLYQIDDFNNEQIQVFIDDVQAYSTTLTKITTSVLKTCGNTLQQDQKFFISFEVAHKANSVSIQIVSKQTQTTATYGIMNFKLFADTEQILYNLQNLDQTLSAGLYKDDWFITKISNIFIKDTTFCPGIPILGAISPNMKIRLIAQEIDSATDITDCHDQINIQFTLYVFSTNLNDYKFSLFMNQTIWETTLGEYSYDVCGSTKGQIIKGDIYLNHTNRTSVFEFSSTPQTQKWGIAEFILKKNKVVC